MKLSGIFVSVCLVMLQYCPSSNAQLEAGTKRLHLETFLFGFENLNLDPEQGNDSKYNTTIFGLGKPQVGLCFGYTLLENLVVGGRFHMYVESGTEKSSTPEKKTTTFNWGILPYGEYVFMSGSIRPFATATLGFKGYRGSFEEGTTEVDFSQFAFYLSGGGGIHAFLLPTLSVDGALTIGFTGGKQKREIPTGERESSAKAFDLSIVLGMSLWL